MDKFKKVKLHHCAKFRWNRSNRNRYIVIFWFFKDGGRRHLEFWNFNFLTVGTVRIYEMHNRTKFRQNRSNSGRNMAIFWCFFFKMSAAAILDFRNFKFLTVVAVKRAELRHHVKFRWNRPKRGRDIAIYRFFKMAPPPSWILKISNF